VEANEEEDPLTARDCKPGRTIGFVLGILSAAAAILCEVMCLRSARDYRMAAYWLGYVVLSTLVFAGWVVPR